MPTRYIWFAGTVLELQEYEHVSSSRAPVICAKGSIRFKEARKDFAALLMESHPKSPLIVVYT